MACENGRWAAYKCELMAHFRNEYPGRENLVVRQQRMTSLYDLIVVVTNQMLDVPEVIPVAKPMRPAGGNVVALTEKGVKDAEVERED
ncbi:MAG: hypothetical protein FJZ49_06260 [Candidatus Verstraetearchaeota archaeon]|nr:hypothetical protein [Candidatus Verstraetearchaeota archaeon]